MKQLNKLIQLCNVMYIMKSTPRAVLKKGVPHQFLSGWEFFLNKQLAGKIQGTPHENNRIIVHKI